MFAVFVYVFWCMLMHVDVFVCMLMHVDVLLMYVWCMCDVFSIMYKVL